MLIYFSLIQNRNSPLAQTPPRIPYIPGVTKETEFSKRSPLLINDLNNNKILTNPKIIEGNIILILNNN